MMGEELPLVPGIERKEQNLAAIGKWTKTGGRVPVALFAPMAQTLTDHARALRATLGHLPYLGDPDRAFRVLGRILEADRRHARAGAAEDASVPAPSDAARRLAEAEARALAGEEPRALDEAASKALLAAWGIAGPREARAEDAAAARAAAEEIGYSVVVKALSADLPHKSEAGAIRLNLPDGAAVTAACEAIARDVAAYDGKIALSGFLVAEQVAPGTEFALGIVRDPEMGPVVMFGTGGVMVELYKDVAFGRPGLDRAEAEAMIDATRAGRLIAGYRGRPALDRAAVVDAILALGAFARDAGALIEAVDVNPLLARPEGEGAVALDALVVLAAKS
jgi:acetyltransferase